MHGRLYHIDLDQLSGLMCMIILFLTLDWKDIDKCIDC